MSEVESLQPWQIFCSMFAIFWLFSAWCDQVLITLLLCIVFGVLSDVITKSMYSSPSQGEKAERQASAEEKKESNEKIWQAAEAQLEEEEEEEEGVPPPLPAKDYTTNTTAHSIHSLADKLQALVDTDEAAVQEEEEDQEQEEEEEDTQPRQYNRTVSDEYNQNTSAVNYNSREGVIAEEGLGQETNDDDDEDEDDDSEEEDGKIYAKDSSDEDDYDYASREVNFNESESATEEEDEVNDENDGGGGDPTKKSVTNTQKNLKDDE